MCITSTMGEQSDETAANRVITFLDKLFMQRLHSCLEDRVHDPPCYPQSTSTHAGFSLRDQRHPPISMESPNEYEGPMWGRIVVI